MTEKYYEILGIDPKASLAEIKKAYRKRAMQLHPDVSTAPDAHEKFVLLNEAYEYFQNLKAGKIYDQKKRRYTRSKRRYNSYEAWRRSQRSQARERARQHARMRYEAFKKTDFYKTTVAISIVINFIFYLVVAFIFIGTPIIGYIIEGLNGIFGSIILIFITTPFWSSVILHNKPELDFKTLKSAFIRVSKIRIVQISSAVLLNIFLIFRIGFSTLITISELAFIFAGAVLLGYFISRLTLDRLMKYLLILGIGPGLVNLFFLINFLFASNVYNETYSIRHNSSTTPYGEQRSTMIRLQEGKYDDFVNIRVFFDYDEMKKARKITYTFADGLFGIRVMKGYEFE